MSASLVTRLLSRAGRRLLAVPLPWSPMLPVLWGALIWWLSSQPADPEREENLARAILHNTGHSFLFGILTLLLVPLAVRWGGQVAVTSRRVLVAAALALLFGVVDEFHQSFVPERSSSVWDLVTDATGCLSVWAVVVSLGADPPRTADQGSLVRRLQLGFLLCWVAGILATVMDA